MQRSKIINVMKRIKYAYKVIFLFIIFLVTFVVLAAPPAAISIKFMKMGLGSGTITSSTGINCGAGCDGTLESGTSITLTATPDAGSIFVRWEGDASGTSNPILIAPVADASVR